MSPCPDFSDLLQRVLSAIVMLVVFALADWAGGDIWAGLLIVIAGMMGWEVSRLHSDNGQVQVAFGMLIASVVLCWLFVSSFWAGVVTALAVATALAAHNTPVTVAGWAAAIAVCCVVLHILRENTGSLGILWFVGIVVATDVGGYFTGRLIGGPRILPRVSPKKTWSGTVGGWVLAAVAGVGGPFLIAGQERLWLLFLTGAIALSIAAQLGDLMESSMKRRAGVKDSSSLIPGHGGLLDRFDGLVGAGVALGVAWGCCRCEEFLDAGLNLAHV
ncbi:MAG: phosphatidate cytidylyltransferase [Rhodobacteraceae bacterium]|nr:phosphatidate cytidylyltransferase [Paracoccaceae bacterium]